MNGGPSGFSNAPVTKTFVIASAIFTIFLRIKGGPNKLGLSYQDIFRNPRLWKLILSVFAFSSTSEMMFGLYLLYYFRVFERQIGSNKYLVFILFSVIVSLLFEIFAVALLKDPSANLLTSGPYGLIFASFVPFYFDIPVSTRFHIFSNHFSDKSFIYLAGVQVKREHLHFSMRECVCLPPLFGFGFGFGFGFCHICPFVSLSNTRDPISVLVLQLLLSSWKRSILPGICGILAGSLYRLNIFGIRKAKFPEFIASFFSQLSWPSTGSPQGPTTRNVTGSARSHAGRHVERTYPAPMAPSTEPTEDAIATLVSMGFDRSSARQALVQARNDINTATNILLEALSN
uniref:UBA domain-containing protein n=1 Tax=Populus trichocarpa TaxID=3694 RepID=A0A3N7G214_POPTR